MIVELTHGEFGAVSREAGSADFGRDIVIESAVVECGSAFIIQVTTAPVGVAVRDDDVFRATLLVERMTR